MIGYASRTGTRVNLAALRKHGWRLLVSATGDHRTEGFPYALDNGAWTAHQKKRAFDFDLFERLVTNLGTDADWVVAPDIVGAGRASLLRTREWLPWCLERCPRVLIGVQDGMVPADVADLVSERVGIAIGGTTDEPINLTVYTGWKIDQLAQDVWGPMCRKRGAILHCLRVNTVRRITLCQDAGCDSFDGTSPSMYRKNITKLDGARRQQLMNFNGGKR